MLLPYIGFCLGYGIARLCGQPVKQAATIALETGIQVYYRCLFLLSVLFLIIGDFSYYQCWFSLELQSIERF